MAAMFPQPMRTGFKLFGKRFLPTYPFEEAYFLPYARQFRDALTMPLVLLGGINRRDTIEHAMADGFEFVAMGRALLREPDLINRLQAGDAEEGLCIHCNKCMPTIYCGTRLRAGARRANEVRLTQRPRAIAAPPRASRCSACFGVLPAGQSAARQIVHPIVPPWDRLDTGDGEQRRGTSLVAIAAQPTALAACDNPSCSKPPATWAGTGQSSRSIAAAMAASTTTSACQRCASSTTAVMSCSVRGSRHRDVDERHQPRHGPTEYRVIARVQKSPMAVERRQRVATDGEVLRSSRQLIWVHSETERAERQGPVQVDLEARRHAVRRTLAEAPIESGTRLREPRAGRRPRSGPARRLRCRGGPPGGRCRRTARRAGSG